MRILRRSLQGIIMKAFVCFALLVMHSVTPVSAASDECRSLQSRMERSACHRQQGKPVAAKRAETASDKDRMIDPVERMKVEDDRLAKRLRGICRGC
jgi:hypothetical protein